MIATKISSDILITFPGLLTALLLQPGSLITTYSHHLFQPNHRLSFSSLKTPDQTRQSRAIYTRMTIASFMAALWELKMQLAFVILIT